MMNKKERCFECKQFLVVGETRCSCGWQLPKLEVNVKPNHGCQYYSKNKGRYCRLFGTMSHSTHGSGTWYCSYHFHTFGDPKQGEEMFDYIEEHYQEILESRVDWRWDLHPTNKKIFIRSMDYENQSKKISVNF